MKDWTTRDVHKLAKEIAEWLNDRSSKAEQWQARAEAAEAECERLREQVATTEAVLADEGKRVEAFKAEVEQLRQELAQCRENLKHEHKRAEGSEKAFAEQFRARQSDMAEAARLRGFTGMLVDALTMSHPISRGDWEDATTAAGRCGAVMPNWDTDALAEVERLRKHVAALEAECERLRGQVATTEAVLADEGKRVEAFKAEVKRLRQELAEARDTLDAQETGR